MVAVAAVGMLAGALVMWATQRPGAPGRQNRGAAPAQAAQLQGTVSTLPTAARTALDSGNTAFRQRQFAAALAQYRLAAAAAPGEAAPYFGVYMAAEALHDTALGDSALVVIRATSGGHGKMLSDSAMRALHGTPPGRHPQA